MGSLAAAGLDRLNVSLDTRVRPAAVSPWSWLSARFPA
jgi:hypothetical protein